MAYGYIRIHIEACRGKMIGCFKFYLKCFSKEKQKTMDDIIANVSNS